MGVLAPQVVSSVTHIRPCPVCKVAGGHLSTCPEWNRDDDYIGINDQENDAASVTNTDAGSAVNEHTSVFDRASKLQQSFAGKKDGARKAWQGAFTKAKSQNQLYPLAKKERGVSAKIGGPPQIGDVLSAWATEQAAKTKTAASEDATNEATIAVVDETGSTSGKASKASKADKAERVSLRKNEVEPGVHDFSKAKKKWKNAFSQVKESAKEKQYLESAKASKQKQKAAADSGGEGQEKKKKTWKEAFADIKAQAAAKAGTGGTGKDAWKVAFSQNKKDNKKSTFQQAAVNVVPRAASPTHWVSTSPAPKDPLAQLGTSLAATERPYGVATPFQGDGGTDNADTKPDDTGTHPGVGRMTAKASPWQVRVSVRGCIRGDTCVWYAWLPVVVRYPIRV